MAYTLNGFGTRFYGEADRRPDGSFITTEWITALYIPLIPFRSFRFARVAGGVNVLVFRSQSYAVLEQLPVHWPQVGRIYLFMLCSVAWWVTIGWLCFAKWRLIDGPEPFLPMILFIAVAAIPFVVVWWNRRKAYRAQHEPKPPGFR